MEFCISFSHSVAMAIKCQGPMLQIGNPFISAPAAGRHDKSDADILMVLGEQYSATNEVATSPNLFPAKMSKMRSVIDTLSRQEISVGEQ